MDSHYIAISNKYDYLYEPLHHARAPLIINNLKLKPDDLMLDIGAATGQQAHLIWKQAGLKNPVTCVEPCEALFEHARKLDGTVPVMQTAEQFCDHLVQVGSQRQFNKVLLCGVVHHIDDIVKCLGQILDYLPKNGVCFISNQSFTEKSLSSLPLTAFQLRYFKETSNPFDIILPYVKSRDDVITEVTNDEPSFRIPKSRWYYMIRNYFWSHFHQYTDKEIEESIKELDNGRFKQVKDDELITVVYKVTGVKITKKEILKGI
ncbi:uncharacterized protein LOC116305700 [Actinia tenebrosa]|uniref:Uncharacterized protein LOC116305700 n=1 Tax=Actinia tenebrosa TaxID=6105 RepID=A0A6P8IWS3_ACTTE|nr:uncharacterized protein LOC116305700 [Actinia tenebrosa]